tara:strand:+ start:185 stop:346 length:162 start_codon:yes stop_codon:yes gene_type:complete
MQYKTHASIDPLMASYVCTVANVGSIYELDIDVINEYLIDMNNYFINNQKDVA